MQVRFIFTYFFVCRLFASFREGAGGVVHNITDISCQTFENRDKSWNRCRKPTDQFLPNWAFCQAESATCYLGVIQYMQTISVENGKRQGTRTTQTKQNKTKFKSCLAEQIVPAYFYCALHLVSVQLSKSHLRFRSSTCLELNCTRCCRSKQLSRTFKSVRKLCR